MPDSFPAARQSAGPLRLALTGATGAIGAALVPVLLQDGHSVQALVRRPSPALPAGVIQQPVSDPSLAHRLAGVDVLIHLAYDMRTDADRNVALFDRVLAAAEAAGVRRLVLASSVAVHDGWPSDGPLVETAPCDGPARSVYALAKRQMEHSLAASRLPETVTLRPTIVWGAPRLVWVRQATAAMASGGVVLPDPVGICPAVHVTDVARAFALAATVPRLTRDTFLINGPDRPDWVAFYDAHRPPGATGQIHREAAAALLARIGPPRVGPPSRPGVAARLGGLARRWIGDARVDAVRRLVRPSSGPHHPSPSELALWLARPEIGSEHARARIGYAPTLALAAPSPLSA